MIKLGNTSIKDMFFGTDPIGRVYQGYDLIYPYRVSPAMIDNITPSGEVKSSGNWSGSENWFAMDDDPTNPWMSHDNNDAWTSYNFGFGNGKIIRGFMMTSANTDIHVATPKKIILHANNGGAVWDILGAWDDLTWGTMETKWFSLAKNNVRYEVFRITVLETEEPTVGYVKIGNLVYYGLDN